MVTLQDLHTIDDGSFNSMMKQIKEDLGDDQPKLHLQLLIETVVKNLVSFFRTEAKRENTSGEKSKGNKLKVNSVQEPLVELPQTFRNHITNMGGSQIKLVIQKKLFATDISKHHNRLSMPSNQIKDKSFLLPEEEERLNAQESIQVKIFIDPSIESFYTLSLKKWKMSKSNPYNYVLMSKWYDIIQDYSRMLRVNTVVQLWSFRDMDSSLCFALVAEREVKFDTSSSQALTSCNSSTKD